MIGLERADVSITISLTLIKKFALDVQEPVDGDCVNQNRDRHLY